MIHRFWGIIQDRLQHRRIQQAFMCHYLILTGADVWAAIWAYAFAVRIHVPSKRKEVRYHFDTEPLFISYEESSINSSSLRFSIEERLLLSIVHHRWLLSN